MKEEEKKQACKPGSQLDPNFYQSKGLGMQGSKGQEYKIQIGTDEIRLIVSVLNGPPFVMNLTLVSFDEKSPYYI
jgi:hypothetical protein